VNIGRAEHRCIAMRARGLAQRYDSVTAFDGARRL